MHICIFTLVYIRVSIHRQPPCILMLTHKIPHIHTHSHVHAHIHPNSCIYTRTHMCMHILHTVLMYVHIYFDIVCVSYNHEYIILMYICIYKDRIVRVHHTPSLMHLLHVLAVWSCAVAWSVLSPAAASLARDAVVIARHIEWLGRRPSLRSHSKTGHQHSQRR